MFKRNVISELMQWSAKLNRKPLILRGSRQVGKTTLVDSFSENFENYLYLNFEKSPSAMFLFDKEQKIADLLADIFLFCDKERKPGKTLLFIDEIQNSKMAITKLRYFYEAKLPDLYIIAAGSLLETMLNRQISFPVGRVEYLAVRPCVFNEFLSAKDILDAWRGKIAEQIVAQELLALDSRVSNLRNFWVRKKNDSDAEVDFVLQHDDRVIPVEVKSGHNAKLKSLHLFMEEAPHNVAVRVWSKPYSIDEITTQTGKKFNLINLPFYYVGRLEEILQNESVHVFKT